MLGAVFSDVGIFMQACNLCAFVLFDPEGCPAVCVNEGIIRINWTALEDLAAYAGDTSPRAADIAKMLLSVRWGGQKTKPASG